MYVLFPTTPVLCALIIPCKTGNQMLLISQWKTSISNKSSDENENQLLQKQLSTDFKTSVQSAFR